MKGAVLLAALLAACTADGPREPVSISFDRLPGWTNDATDRAFTQFRRECDRLGTLSAREDLGGGKTAGDFAPACLAARQVLVSDAVDARRFFEHWFAAYDVGATSYAGYFEPEYPGSLSREGAYQTPLLARPADLVTVASPDGHGTLGGRQVDGRLVPYATRAEIDGGALDGRGLELLWLADPVDLFFLQLQGAGRVRLPSGQVVHVGYAGKNGRPYVPLGRLMVERGYLAAQDATSAHIRDWLEEHRSQQRALLEKNQSYVFFRALPGVSLTQGAPGTLGVPLAPLRSVAVGRAVPIGAPVFVMAGDLRTLMLAQDTSSDGTTLIFFGWGTQARDQASVLQTSGRLVVLLPRPVQPVT